MAVKFSDFTEENVAGSVSRIVGYTATGDLNIQIPPANLDTLVTSDTAQAGTSATYTLTGTKTGTSTTTDLTTYTVPANSGMSLTAGTNTIAFDATSYSLASTDSVVGNNSVPVNLTGTGGGDSREDTVTIVGTGTVQVSSATNTITIDGGSTGDVTSFTNSNGGTFVAYGTVNTASTGPVTIGDVDLTAIDGTSDANTKFLSKDNTWDVPTYTVDTNTTYSVDVPSGTTSINLKSSDAIDDAIVLVGGNEIGLVRDSANQITINSQAASYSSWTVAGDTGNTPVNSGETATIAGGTGINTAEVNKTVTVNIDYAGADNAILAASAATVAAADTIWFSDAGDSTIKKGVVSDLPFNETLQEVCTAGNTTTTAILAGDGTVSLPSLAFTTEPDTGMYRSAANALSLVTGGAAALTIDANQNGTFNSTGATTLPVGDDAARPTPTNGMIRYSTTANGFEGYINGAWGSIGGGVTITKEQETGNGTTTDFTLTTAAGCTVDNLAIYISGVYQNKLDASGAANFTVDAGANPTLQFVSGGTPTAPPVTAANGIEIVITR